MDIDPTILYRSTHQTNTLTNTLKAGGGGMDKYLKIAKASETGGGASFVQSYTLP